MPDVIDPAPDRRRDVVVVGSGRSGTSLAAGLVSTAGHHMGRHLVRASDANPLGFFEDYRTLLLNEQLLEPYTKDVPESRFTDGPAYPEPLGDLQRWLAVLWLETVVEPTPELAAKLPASITGRPWCRKDPRFCYTLPAWEPLIGDAVRLCVFREPSRTANSMMKLAVQQRVALSFDGGLEIWAASYLQVLRRHRHRGEWVFVHYDQLLDGTGLARIEAAIGARLDPRMADPALRRAPVSGGWPAGIGEIYDELCDAAGYSPGSDSASN